MPEIPPPPLGAMSCLPTQTNTVSSTLTHTKATSGTATALITGPGTVTAHDGAVTGGSDYYTDGSWSSPGPPTG